MTEEDELTERQTEYANLFLSWFIALTLGVGGTVGFGMAYVLTGNTGYRNAALIPLALMILSCCVMLWLLGMIGAIQNEKKEQ